MGDCVRRRSRIDANQPAITRAMRQLGAVVTPIHTLGKGVPDLLVSWRQNWFVIEVKDGAKPPSDRQLTPDEREWIGAQKAPVHIIESVEQAVSLLIGYEFSARSRGTASARAVAG